MNASLNSGLRVPTGEDLQVTVNGRGTFTPLLENMYILNKPNVR